MQVLAQCGESASKVASRRARRAPDQLGALVNGVAKLVMQRDDGSLLAGQPAESSIEVGIGFVRVNRVGVVAVLQPEPWQNPPPQPKRSPYANPTEPGGALERITQVGPGPPGQLHGFLHRVLGFLDIAQDRV